MPIFILLSTLTQQGVQTLKSNPERLLQVSRTWRARRADAPPVGDAGEFDFVSIVEAPDVATIGGARSRGSTRIETCRRSKSRVPRDAG
jgi:uncharacterized protein with GYD domain